jgi:hypothetical protein
MISGLTLENHPGLLFGGLFYPGAKEKDVARCAGNHAESLPEPARFDKPRIISEFHARNDSEK